MKERKTDSEIEPCLLEQMATMTRKDQAKLAVIYERWAAQIRASLERHARIVIKIKPRVARHSRN